MFAADLFMRTLAAPLFAGTLLGSPIPSPSPASLSPPPPVTEAAANYYWGRIDRIWTDHDIWRNGYKGLLIHVSFRTGGLRGTSCKAVAYFAYEGGERLNDYDGAYKSDDGQVSAWVDFTPMYENTTFNDLQIFIPYTQLHMAPGEYDLQYHIVLFSMTYGAYFARSQPVTFWMIQP